MSRITAPLLHLRAAPAIFLVMAGLVPAISIRDAPCPPKRDRRDKPGDDGCECCARAECAPALLIKDRFDFQTASIFK
jgi:hypothetical protein